MNLLVLKKYVAFYGHISDVSLIGAIATLRRNDHSKILVWIGSPSAFIFLLSHLKSELSTVG